MKKMKKYDMIKDDPGKSLFFFALPMIIGNLFQQFYNMADSVIVGQLVGEDALAAVGASYSLTCVFIMIAIGGGIGAGVITAQYLGAGLHTKMKTSILTALISFLFLGTVLSLFGLLFHQSILHSLHTPENIMAEAVLYLKIYFCGLPFLFMYNILSSVFNALGNSKIPLYLLIFSSILNVLLDLVTVGLFAMGVAGAAIATVFSQGLSAVIAFLLLWKLEFASSGEAGEKPALFDPGMLGNMIRIAIPSMLQQSIVSIGMLLVQSVVNGFGSAVLAGYSAGSRIESICIVPMIATGNAVSTFTAQNLGADRKDRIKSGYRAAIRMIAAFAAAIGIILTLFHKPIIGLFLEKGSDSAAAATGSAYMSFLAFFFGLIGLKSVTDGVLKGAGDVVVFTLANLLNLSIRVLFAFSMAGTLGAAAVWIAVPIGWSANFLVSFIRYLSGKWSCKKLI